MENKNNLQVWKISIGIISALILLLLVVSYFISHKLQPLLEKGLKDALAKSSEGLYSLTYSDLNLDIAGGTLHFKDLNLFHDSIVYMKLDTSRKAPNIRFEGSANSLKLSGLSIWEILVNKKIQIGSIELDSLNLKAKLRNRSYNIGNGAKKDLYGFTYGYFGSICAISFSRTSF